MPRTFGVAFVLALTGAMTPGPVWALVVGQVLAQGIMAAVFILVGHAILEAAVVVGFGIGLTQALSRAKARGVVALLGGAVLVWMGQDILRNVSAMSLHGTPVAPMAWYTLVLAGAGVSLANPYFAGWWATVGTGQVAALGLRSRWDFLVFWIGHELGDVAWYMFMAVVLVVGRGWLTDAAYHALMYVCGAVIAAMGVAFMAVGLRYAARRNDSAAPAGPDVSASRG
jgi:threonine/homoserine/homoserine lactone efflux protein